MMTAPAIGRIVKQLYFRNSLRSFFALNSKIIKKYKSNQIKSTNDASGHTHLQVELVFFKDCRSRSIQPFLSAETKKSNIQSEILSNFAFVTFHIHSAVFEISALKIAIKCFFSVLKHKTPLRTWILKKT